MSRRYSGWLAGGIALLLAGVSIVSAAPEKDKKQPVTPVVYTVQRATGPITIDGKLDEADWRKAGKLDFVEAGANNPPLAGSVGRILYDDQYIYWSMEMVDLDVYGRSYGHDPEWGRDDVAEIFIKPGSWEKGYWPHGYWELHITPTGGYRDYFYARRNAGADERWLELGDSGTETAVTIDGTLNHWTDIDKGWIAEARVPLSAFSTLARKPQPGDKWKFLMARYDYSAHSDKGLELSTSSPISQVNFHLYEDYGYMVFGK